MTPPPRNRAALLLSVIAVTLTVLAGCAWEAGPAAPSTAPAGDVVDAGGASELTEPARALVVADGHGELTLVDLETEEREVIAEGAGEISGLDGNGRFAFVSREDGGTGSVEIVDSGRWTMPHGDHSHYFRGEPRTLGSIEGAGAAAVGVGSDGTAVSFGGSEVVILGHEMLAEDGLPEEGHDEQGHDEQGHGEQGHDEQGETDQGDAGQGGAGQGQAEHGEAEPHADAANGAASAVLPFAGQTVVSTASGIEVPGSTPIPCSEPSDADITRVGAVLACADGAVLVTREVGGALAAESIPYPAGTTDPASALAGRTDRPDLAGIAGQRGAWLLDVRQRSWALLSSDTPLLRAVAVGDDDSRTVVVAVDGSVRILGDDGSVLARTEPLIGAVATENVQLLVDAEHAYVSDPSTGDVHEIDLDDARISRTFTGLQTRAFVLVG